MTPERLAEINRQRTHIRDAVNSGDMPDQLSLLLAYAEVASDVTVEVRNHEASRELLYATEHQLAAKQERIAALEAALGEIEQAPYTTSGDTETILDRVLWIARAALAGSQGGGGKEVAPTVATEDEPWCTVDQHIVLPSGEACVCGENRMELML